MSAGPVRTCVGCRRPRPKGELLRLAREASGRVVADPRSRRPGRGAYVCADPACLERALGRGRLGHAFRKPCEAGTELAGALRAEREIRSEEVRGLWQRQRSR